MNFVQAIQSGFKNYVKFDGRARRSEYWWFFLFQIIVLLIPDIMMQGEIAHGAMGIGAGLYGIGALVFFLPALGLGFRRLHDTNRSAWWLLISLIPLIGAIVLIVFLASPGTAGPNKYGADPKGMTTNAAGVF